MNLDQASSNKEIARLTVLAVGSLVAEPLFLMSDAAIVGHLGTAQLAALGVGSGLLLNLVNLCLFLTFATTAAVARRAGAGDLTAALAMGVASLWLAAALGLVITAIGAPLASTLVAAFGTAPAASGYATSYLGISMLGVPSMLIVLAATGLLRGLGDARTPFTVAFSAATINIALNVTLVFGAGLGIVGSALGTAIAQTTAATWLLWIVVRKLHSHQISIFPDRRALRVVGVGSVPLLIRTLTLRVGLLGMTFVATAQGEVALASHQIALTVSGLFEIPAGALGLAAQVLVGHALGADDKAAAQFIVRRVMLWGLFSGIILGVLLICLRPAFIPLFSHDDAVRHLLTSVLVVLALIQPIGGVLYVLDGVFIGAGDGRYLALAGVATLCAFLPLLALVLAAKSGLLELWFALTAYLASRLVTLLYRVRANTGPITGTTRGRSAEAITPLGPQPTR